MFLPCTLWGEKTGTVTNLEGRVQRVGRKVAPEGTAMDDWRIASELAFRLGTRLRPRDRRRSRRRDGRVAPAQLGRRQRRCCAARATGSCCPLREHLDELVLRTGDLTIMAEDGQGTSWDPIKVEGEVPEDPTEVVADVEPEVTAAAPAPETACASTSGTARIVRRQHPAPRRVRSAARVGRTLYDGGRIVAETPLLATLAPDPACCG